MLMMQKELPDGSGFPKGLKHVKILPMAALLLWPMTLLMKSSSTGSGP
jgi:hypothetical protein